MSFSIDASPCNTSIALHHVFYRKRPCQQYEGHPANLPSAISRFLGAMETPHKAVVGGMAIHSALQRPSSSNTPRRSSSLCQRGRLKYS